MIALVQRPRRKKHLAVTRPDGTTWDTLGSCRLSLPVDGTDFITIDGASSVGTIEEQDTDVCIPCLHLIAFAHVLERGLIARAHLSAIA